MIKKSGTWRKIIYNWKRIINFSPTKTSTQIGFSLVGESARWINQ